MTREEIAGCLEAACKLCDAAYDAWKADQRSERFWADYTSAQRTASDVLRAYQNAILAALREPPEPTAEEVERAAEVIAEVHQCDWGTAAVCTAERCMCKLCAAAALRAARSRP